MKKSTFEINLLIKLKFNTEKNNLKLTFLNMCYVLCAKFFCSGSNSYFSLLEQ